MLSLYAHQSFALSRSPLREQRELLFANIDPNNPLNPPVSGNEQHEEEGQPETNRTFDDERLVERATKDIATKFSSVLRTLDSQEIFERLGEELKHGEIFDRLFTHEESTKKVDLSSIARRSGIAMYMSERDSLLPEGNPREVFSAILDFDTKQGFPIEMKRTFVEMLLQASPGITAAFARSTVTRIKDYEEQQIAIETARERFGEEEMLGRIGSEGMEVASRLSLGEIPNIPAAINEISAKHPLTTDQIRELAATLDNVSEAMRKSREFGNRYWGTAEMLPPEQDEKRKLAYLRHLKEQVRDLSRLLSIQLRLGAQETVQHLEEGAAAAMKQAKSQDLKNEIQRSAADPGMRALKLIAKVDDPKNDLVQDPDNPNFTRLSDGFLSESEGHLAILNSIRSDADRLLKRWRSPEGLQDEAQDQKERLAWAGRCLSMLEAVLTDPQLSQETRNSLEILQKELRDPDALAAFSDEQMAREEYVLKTLVERGDAFFQLVEQEATDATQTVTGELQANKLADWSKQKRGEIFDLRDNLLPQLTHPVCTVLNIPSQLQEYAERIDRQLMFLGNEKIPEATRRDMATRLGAQIRHWRTALDGIRALEQATQSPIPAEGNTLVVFLDDASYQAKFQLTASRACYREGKIFIRRKPNLTPQDIEQLVQHEKAHALLDILSDQSHLLPELMESAFGEVSTDQWLHLEQQGERWGVPTKEEVRAEYRRLNPAMPEALLNARADAHYHRLLLNEAVVSGALAAAGHLDRTILDQMKAAPNHGITAPEFTLHELDEPTPTVGAEAMEQGQQSPIAYNALEDLEEIERMITGIQTFGNAYGTLDPRGTSRHFDPNLKRQADQIVGNGSGDGGYADVLNELNHIWLTGKTRAGQSLEPDPQHNQTYIQTVQRFKQHVKKTTGQVDKMDKEFAEITAEPSSKKQSLQQMLGIQTLCVLDLIRIFKELKEDVEGIWHSIQDQKTADAKAALTKNMPVYIPGTNIRIPILGKYTERLPHYTERKRNQLELDRVKKWEDAFTNLDAEELLGFIGETPTRDQLRGSIQLLVQKGRMNWNDHRVWKALNEKSKYTMPFGPCDRDETLRDKWLHKLIADIWTDKDMFNEWMTGNSGNFDKHKQNYTHEADNFANIAGKTAYELHVMLKTYVECHDKFGNLIKPLPEEINPHHYEELLHYSMRNGKMSMEQKVYFLIQGVASGFLPLERLRVIAGEKGGVLLKFPFLDYFYQRHNTLAEIKDIAERITEYGPDGQPTFEPGAKTTMFMRLVILRDQKARERISKALDKGAEGLDHEDIPYLATEIDWVKMDSLLGVMSGARSKVSKEGWKNAYVGFNEKFKVYADLARLARENKAVMTESDIRDLAQSIGAYIVMDNQMMRASSLKPGQVSLTNEALEIERPVSCPYVHTGAFRNRTRNFVWELAQTLGMQDSDVGVQGVTLKQFLSNPERDSNPVPPDLVSQIDKARDPFIRALTKKIVADPNTLIRVLAQFEEGEFKDGKKFLDSRAEDERGTGMMTYEDFQERYDAVVGK
ncbi:hypothetical protein AUJ46_03935 [Candidatus Peregrinibacteria bacterium CG1_02_54_53]|nr:MAG: hypothetical protein AUJ46_03935 [Candidatus Peregrinibacteria bacterium CG1_02_54_53]